MKKRCLIFNPFLALAVLFILAVSVAPAMAADANSRQMNGFTAGSTGMGSPSPNAGSEHNAPALQNAGGISAGSPVTGLRAESGTDNPVKKEEKPKKVPWYKKWWVCVIVVVAVIVIVAATVATYGAITAATTGAFAEVVPVSWDTIAVTSLTPIVME